MSMRGLVIAGLRTSHCLIRSIRTWAGTVTFSPLGQSRKLTSTTAQRTSYFGSTLPTVCTSNPSDILAKATALDQSTEAPTKPVRVKYLWGPSDEVHVVGIFHALGITSFTSQPSKGPAAMTTAPIPSSLQRCTALTELDSAISRGHLSQALEWYAQIRKDSCFTQMTNQRYHALGRLCLFRLRQSMGVEGYHGLMLT
ncbi:hypothetical protein IWQ61_005971, partial [Dispira simplex]